MLVSECGEVLVESLLEREAGVLSRIEQLLEVLLHVALGVGQLCRELVVLALDASVHFSELDVLSREVVFVGLQQVDFLLQVWIRFEHSRSVGCVDRGEELDLVEEDVFLVLQFRVLLHELFVGDGLPSHLSDLVVGLLELLLEAFLLVVVVDVVPLVVVVSFGQELLSPRLLFGSARAP